MADLNNGLDLNAPVAPTLTLDSAPAAPTLTLDPAADEKIVEESKKATPVQVEDTPLSPEEQKMVNDFAEKIDLTNSQMVLQYGAASQKKLSDFSETALSRVKTQDMGETGELITGSRQYSLNLCLQPFLQVFFHARLNLRPNGVVHGCNTWAAQSYQLFYIAFRISPAWAISFCPGVF